MSIPHLKNTRLTFFQTLTQLDHDSTDRLAWNQLQNSVYTLKVPDQWIQRLRNNAHATQYRDRLFALVTTTARSSSF